MKVEEGAQAEENEKLVGPQLLRCRFIEVIHDAVSILSTVTEDTLARAQSLIETFIKEIDDSKVTDNEFVKSLREDAAGQSKEAVSRADWYRKWGCHYMPSIVFAHKTQQCDNFKDPGVQDYGGSLFKYILEEADKKFNSLPPPTPSARSVQR